MAAAEQISVAQPRLSLQARTETKSSEAAQQKLVPGSISRLL